LRRHPGDLTRALIFIDQTLLSRGLVVPRTITREKQKNGELPKKPIKSVTRFDPPPDA
jgi:hypothetical protein